MKLNEIQDSIEGGIRVLISSPLILVPAICFGLLNVFLTFVKLAHTPEYILIAAILVISLALFAIFCRGMVVRMSYDVIYGKASLYKSANFVFRRYSTLLLANMILGVFIVIPMIIGSLFPTLILFASLRGLLPGYFFIPSSSGIPYAMWMGYALGFVFIIIFLFMSIKLIFYTCAILLDGSGIIGSFKKSWNVTKGNWWGVFFICLIFGSLSAIPSMTDGLLPSKIVLILRFASGLIVTPLLYSALTIAYLNLRK